MYRQREPHSPEFQTVVIPERSTHIGMYPQSLCYYIGHLCWNGVDGCGSAQYSHGLLDGSLIIWTAFIARKTYTALTEANSVKTIPSRHYFVLADPFSGPDKVILFFFQFSLWRTPSGIFRHLQGRHPDITEILHCFLSGRLCLFGKI